MTVYSERGDQFRARYQITDVTRPLNSVSRICDQGNNVLFTHGRMDETDTRGFLGNMVCMCCAHGSMSLFQGRSAKILRFRGTRGTSGLCKTSLEES